MAKILSGKPVAKLIKARLQELIAEYQLKPVMCLIQVGVDPAADFYVKNIISNAAKLGCEVQLTSLPAETTQAALISAINAANADRDIHGIMIQKPLPANIDDIAVGMAVSADKDIDCLNPLNLGKIILETDGFVPCTPLAVICALRYYQIPVAGSHVLIIGRSAIVGKPLANMLLWKKPGANATVTVCHSKSKDLSSLTRTADIVVAALGRAEFLKGEMIKADSILLDVGINEQLSPDGKLAYVGDVDYNSCQDRAMAISPVPGGIGSITSSLLFFNLLKACLASMGINKSIDEILNLNFNEKYDD